KRHLQLLVSLFCFLFHLKCFPVGLPADDFDEVAGNLFWNELYKTGGWTLYCGYRFNPEAIIDESGVVVIDQLYPVHKMLKKLNCNSRKQCRQEKTSSFARMEADMHNLYPVWQEVQVLRRGNPFAELEGEDWRFAECDFEKRLNVVEPRPIARGNIARAILYMYTQYQLPLSNNTLQLMINWNRNDPPSQQERVRNNLIEELQGSRNPFIDRPAEAESLLQQ
ncbi:MAG: endonuclease, partial [Pseudomonadota bacterium]